MSNTGYIINTYKDINPYSSTYNNTTQQRIYDIVTCPLELGEVDFVVSIPSNNFTDNQMIIKNSNMEIDVDWGDGTTGNYKSGNYISKTYALAGEYNIKISSVEAGLNGDIDCGKQTIRINKYKTNATLFNQIINSPNTLLTELKANVFYLDSLTQISQPFSGLSGLTTVEEGVFDNINKSNVSQLYGLFYSCANLKTIPINILNGFDVTSLSYSFYNNYALEVNINDLLSYIDLSKITNMSRVFCNDSLITGEALPVINQLTSVTSKLECFKNCTSLSDYDLIPSDWK